MDLQEAQFVVFDTETDDVDRTTCRVLEIGAVVTNSQGEISSSFSSYVQTDRPILPEVSATHHIVVGDLEGAPTRVEVAKALMPYLGKYPWVAHNLNFDEVVVSQQLGFTVPADCLCTFRLAKKLWPDAGSHGLQPLAYMLGLYFGIPRAERVGHAALADVHVTVKLLVQELELCQRKGLETVEAVVKWCWEPVFVEKCPFPKYRGQSTRTLPTDYMQWILGNIKDLDDDLKQTFLQILHERGG